MGALLWFFTAALENGHNLVMGLEAALEGWGPLASAWTVHQRRKCPASHFPAPALKEGRIQAVTVKISQHWAQRAREQSLALLCDCLPVWE